MRVSPVNTTRPRSWRPPIGLAAMAIVLVAAGAARADAVKCRAAIIKSTAAFVQARAKALQSCEQAKLGGKLALGIVCTAEPKTSARLAKAREKLATGIAKACGGDDKTCGTGGDDDLAAIGWNVGTCPDFETGDCTNPITTCADIPTCLACVNEGTVDQAIGLYYGALTPTDPKTKDKTEKALRKCQAAIGKATTAFFAGKSKTLAKCWSAVNKAGSGACPDAAASAAIDAARAKQAATVRKACAGLDKAPGTADDFGPAAVGFPAACQDVAPVGAASCGGAVATLTDLVACVDCVTRFSVDCADRVAVPAFVATYADECNPPGVIRRECKAQRVVHIVGGNGSLGWFTQMWPLPTVVSNFNPTYAFDDPAKVEPVPGTPAGHPLFARLSGNRRLFEGLGTAPDPTVFVAGTNQTHNASPTTTTLAGGPEVVAAGAALQGDLATGVPVISFGALPFGPAPGAPAATVVADVEAAIAALKAATTITPATEQALRPSSAQLAALGITPGSFALATTLASRLLFAANAFRLGLVGTVVMPGFNDDPHNAFDDFFGTYTPKMTATLQILDGFYAELAKSTEPKCGQDGVPPSLADNTVLVVTGDTFKHPFERLGWSDSTPGNANLLYVRSNGFLRPGWFGFLIPVQPGRIDFDPVTGDLVGVVGPETRDAASASARLATLFAITRGNAAVVAGASSAPYGAAINP